MTLSPTQLPPFSMDRTVRSRGAKQDKIALTVGEWRIEGTSHQLEDFSIGLHRAEAVDSDGVVFPFLGSRRQISPTRAEHRIVGSGRGSGSSVEGPLFSGLVRMSGRPGANGLRARVVHADLAINPTRFVHHQPLVQFPPTDPSEWDLGPVRMRRRLGMTTPARERTLIAADNVLVGTSRRLFFSAPPLWTRHLDRYWQGVLSILGQVIDASAQACGCAVTLHPTVSLSTVETYWEFQDPAPIQRVDALEGAARAIGRSANRRDYPFLSASTGVEENSPRLSVDLATGIALKIYSKTDGRIRFEIEHKLRECRVLPRHTAEDHGSLIRWLNAISDDAAARLNRFLDDVQAISAPPTSPMTILELIGHVTRASSEPTDAATVLDILVMNGRSQPSLSYNRSSPSEAKGS